MVATVATTPDWAKHLTRLREREGLTQTALAAILNVSPMSVSRWERGVQEPSPGIFLQLGNIARDGESWFFWRKAGLSIARLKQLLKDPGTATELHLDGSTRVQSPLRERH